MKRYLNIVYKGVVRNAVPRVVETAAGDSNKREELRTMRSWERQWRGYHVGVIAEEKKEVGR